jgi:hypothetical protein
MFVTSVGAGVQILYPYTSTLLSVCVSQNLDRKTNLFIHANLFCSDDTFIGLSGTFINRLNHLFCWMYCRSNLSSSFCSNWIFTSINKVCCFPNFEMNYRDWQKAILKICTFTCCKRKPSIWIPYKSTSIKYEIMLMLIGVYRQFSTDERTSLSVSRRFQSGLCQFLELDKLITMA